MSYKTTKVNSVSHTPITGLMSGAVLQSAAIPFYGIYWRFHEIPTTGNGNAAMRLPQFIYNYLVKNGVGQAQTMARRLFVFKNGIKMTTNVFTLVVTQKEATITTANGESYITFFPEAGPFADDTYIEVLCLDETVFSGSSHYQKTLINTPTDGNFPLNFNPSAYVSMRDFYRNVLVFRNGLFMAPARTYFWWESDLLNFQTPLTAGERIELYFLNKSNTKIDRIYGQWPSTVAGTTLVMPEFPNTPFTPLP